MCLPNPVVNTTGPDETVTGIAVPALAHSKCTCQAAQNESAFQAARTDALFPDLDATVPDLIRSVREQGLEGLVAKRRRSVYEPGQRSGAWLKMRGRSQENEQLLRQGCERSHSSGRNDWRHSPGRESRYINGTSRYIDWSLRRRCIFASLDLNHSRNQELTGRIFPGTELHSPTLFAECDAPVLINGKQELARN
jgi:hypothetical protein